jgi:hypothetical protein
LASVERAEPAYKLEARLTCNKQDVRRRERLVCEVMLVNNRSGAPVVVPWRLLPFELPFRPATVIEFEARSGSHSSLLRVSESAARGRYDMALLSPDALFILYGGAIYGWQYDLNGDDWLLPDDPGEYQITARLRVFLLQVRPDGSVDPAVKEIRSKYPQAGNLFMHGEWQTNPVAIRVR